MGRSAFFLLLPLLVAAGCATATRPAGPVVPQSWTYPADARITQRGIMTALGKQYTMNGFLFRSVSAGQRLVITENFGQILADVLVKPDGSVFVMRSSRAFKSKWIRRFVAADLKGIFGSPQTPDPGIQLLSENHFAVRRRWYSLDLRILDVQAGPQPAAQFDASQAEVP